MKMHMSPSTARAHPDRPRATPSAEAGRRGRPTRRALAIAPLPLWGTVCFFLSGAAGLLYEVVWSKQLAYLLGSSLHSIAAVVATFLAGLALGARLLGVPLARRGDGPRVYAALELGVAVLGLLTLPILRALDPLIGEVYRALGGEGTAFAWVRLGILFAVLLPPAALMGATLPVLVGHFERDLVGPALARLYALNTFGAVAGSLAGGFVLLPQIGLFGSTLCAAALNLAAAGLAWRAAAPAPAPAVPEATATPRLAVVPRAEPSPAARAPGRLTGSSRLVFALLFALSGFAALALQIAWVRVFTLIFGSSVYSFSAVLGVYLLGLALGSALVARLLHRLDSTAAFGRLQLVLGLAAGLVLFTFPRLPEAMLAMGAAAGASWGALLASEVMLTAFLILVPCLLLGAAFPIATRVLQTGDGGHAAGFAYAVNTLGTIAGSLVAGFVAVPELGAQNTIVATVALILAIGLASIGLGVARRQAPATELVLGVAGAALGAVVIALAPRWDPVLMNSGTFRPVRARGLEFFAGVAGGDGRKAWRATRIDRVLYYREGINGSVMVTTNQSARDRWLHLSGKVDASTGDMATQVLLGLIPAALADSGARAAVIGLGSGYTLAAALAAGAGPTDVIELERGVVEGSRFFHPEGEGPLADPRVNLIVGDARTHIQHGAGRYGLIVSEPTNPWVAGVNNVFTVDFYRRVARRLEPGGVFCQWLQLYELSPETFGSLVASFLEVFPEGQLFCVWPHVDLIMVSGPPGRALDLNRLRTPAARRLLEIANVGEPENLAAYYAGPLSALREAAAGATLNRDDRPVVEYRAPRDLVRIGRSAAHGHPEVVGRVPFAVRPPEGPLFSAWSPPEWREARVRHLVQIAEVERASVVAESARAVIPAAAPRLEAMVEAGRRRKASHALSEQARYLLAKEDVPRGVEALEKAVATDPTNGEAWLLLSNERGRAQRLNEAADAIARARATGDPDLRAEIEIMAGRLEAARGRHLEAAARFGEATRWNPRLGKAYLLETRSRRKGGDDAGARAALERGLHQLPGEPQLLDEQVAMGVHGR